MAKNKFIEDRADEFMSINLPKKNTKKRGKKKNAKSSKTKRRSPKV